MKLPFLDRRNELKHLERIFQDRAPVLGVVYGRRRCGKSTLLQQAVRKQDVYFLADRRDAALQLESLAGEIDRQIPGFASVRYPAWDVLLTEAGKALADDGTLVLDEFPYLVQVSPELPGVMQRLFDTGSLPKIVICGSSQRMMFGLVLDGGAPLYGRAREILKIEPLAPGWIRKALNMSGTDAVTAYGIWGGVPRYWELAAEYRTSGEAVRDLVLDRNGVLHQEPERLLLDEFRTATQAHSLLALIGNGCHRLSEIAARMTKPATSLTRPLEYLVEMGYVVREVPFNENTRSTKRTLYKLADPFLAFWYRFVQPNRSLLQQGMVDAVDATFASALPEHTGSIWEEMARRSVAGLGLGGISWLPGRRWWGTGRDGNAMEVDVVSRSLDGSALLVGEVKWGGSFRMDAVEKRLRYCAENLPGAGAEHMYYAVWCRGKYRQTRSVRIVGPDEVLNTLE